ncbi:hypothetical protein ACS0TY_034095 [Phlomoides rotata]
MYELYRAHARSVGFSVRKTTNIFSRDDNNVLLSKLKNGILPEKRKVKRKIGIAKTNCKAQMRARLTEDGKYEVPKYILQHNHTLTRKEWNHLHRSE